jgi:hypothetical protein
MRTVNLRYVTGVGSFSGVIPTEARNASAGRGTSNSFAPICHPDEASDASGWKDLGQLRASGAGSGFESPHPIFFTMRDFLK